MKVKALIKLLQELPPNAEIQRYNAFSVGEIILENKLYYRVRNIKLGNTFYETKEAFLSRKKPVGVKKIGSKRIYIV